jgi:hypothetical protein
LEALDFGLALELFGRRCMTTILGPFVGFGGAEAEIDDSILISSPL